MSESKYEVAKEWYKGFAAVLQGSSRLMSESDHWLAGWDAGYRCRIDQREVLNDYLESIGMEPMRIVRIQAGS